MPRLYRALLIIFCGCIQSLPLFAAETADGRSVMLIAAEDMADPRFRQSVVLVTRHGRGDSTLGVIVNRALDAGLDRVFPELTQAAEHRLHYGGPVAPGQIVFMLRGETAPASAIVVAERLFLSSDGDSLRQLLEASTPAGRLRVFTGFASWAPGQLENEIDRGDWYLLPVDVDAIFSDPPHELWLKLWRRATQVMVRTPQPGSPRLAALGEADYFRMRVAPILGHSLVYPRDSP